MPNKKKLYEALKAEGYDNFADESSFNAYVDNVDNRKKLFSALKQEGYDNFADETEFEKYLGYNNSEDNSAFEANAERFRNGQPIERVTTQSVIDANPELELGDQPYQYKPEVQEHILKNKPDMFKPKQSLMDAPLGINAPEGSDEKFQARINVAQKNLQDPEYQKGRVKSEFRVLSDSVNADLEKIEDAITSRQKAVRNIDWKPGVTSSRDDAKLSELRGQRTYLEGAKELIEDSQNILNAVEAEKDGSFFGGLGRGIRDKAFDIDTWTMGLSDLVGGLRLKSALEKAEKGENLTPAEQKLLDASVNNMAVNFYYRNDLGLGYQAGEITGQSIPFMLEFLVNPVSASGNAMAKRLLTYGLKRFGSAVNSKAIKVGTRLATDALAAGGVTATTGMGHVLSGGVERLNRNYEYGLDEEGNLNVVNTHNMSVGEAFAKSAASAFLERQSEMIFNAFRGAPSLFKGIEASLPGGVNTFMNYVSSSRLGELWRGIKNNATMKELAKRTQFHGLGEEYLEEVYNNFANIPLGEMTFEEATELENNIVTFLGLAPTQVMFSAIGGIGYGVERYKAKRDLERTFGKMTEEQKRKLMELQEMGKLSTNKDIAFFLAETIKDESLTPEQKRAEIEYAYNLAKQNAIDEVSNTDVEDSIESENQQIDSVTNLATGEYIEVERWVLDGETGERVPQPGYIVGWIGEAPVFVPEGMENAEENRIVLKPNEWNPETVQRMPAEEVKALNEEMIREEAARQAEREAKYAPEVLSQEMQQGIPFETEDAIYVPISPMLEGNGWVVEVQPKGVDNKSAARPFTEELTNDQFHDLLQTQLDAQEAAQAEAAKVEESNQSIVEGLEAKPMEDGTGRVMQPKGVQGNEVVYDITDGNGTVLEEGSMDAAEYNGVGESVGEQVNAGVKTQVNNPNVQPVTEGVATKPQAEVKPQTPVIPTKEDGSVDFVSYGKEGTFKALGEKYGEKMPNKVAVTAKALADDLAKAQKKLDKAIEDYDNAPIGREDKAEKARDKAQQELDAIKREADFWAEMDIEIKDAQFRRASMLNPQAETETSNEPMNADEFVAQQLSAGNIVLNKEDYKRETGYGDAEANAMNGGAAKIFGENGMTIQEAGERLMEMDRENGTNFFDQTDSNAGRDALISLLGNVKSRKELNQYIANNRAEQAKKESEGLRNELERSVMEANYASLEDYVLQMEASEMENPFSDINADEILAIFAEAVEEYNNYLNPQENGQGTTEESIEGNGELLSEEQSSDTGGTEVRQESARDGEGAAEESETADAATEVELKQQEGETPLQFAERAAEENRRRPLRKRAEEWSKALGVDVIFVERLEDVDSQVAYFALMDGEKVSGWYEGMTGKVYFYMPNLDDISEVDKTYIHEVVAHKGLKEMLGKERFDELCDKVWDMMPSLEKAKFIRYPGVKGNTRAAADEYIAHLAEKEDLTPEEKTMWDRVVKAFRDIFETALNAIIGKVKLTDEDISNLIKASYANLKSGAEGGAVGEGTRFSAKKKRALETASVSRGKHQPTVVSSADGANILNNLDNLAKEYEEKSSQSKTFLGDLSKAIGARKQGSGSQYATFETVNGNVVTIRLADHNATVSNFDNRDENEGISIVVSAKDNNGITNDGDAHIVEYFYDSINLRRADGKPLAEIVKSIKQSLYSGEFKDTTGLAERQEVNESRLHVVKYKNGKKTLIGLHNISEAKLKKAIKQGGLANPSVAVIDMDKQSHVDYGDITLVAPADLIDKNTGRSAGTYMGDAWTPVYPKVTLQLDNKGWKKINQYIESIVEDRELQNNMKYGVEMYMEGENGMYMNFAFLKAKGLNPEIFYKNNDGYISTDDIKKLLGVEEIDTSFEGYSKLKDLPEETLEELKLWARTYGNKAKIDSRKKRLEEIKNQYGEDSKAYKLMAKPSDELGYGEFDRLVVDTKRKERDNGKIDSYKTFNEANYYVAQNGLRQEFENWMDELLLGAGAKEVFFAGYTPSGNKRYMANTIENVSKFMNKQSKTNAYDETGFGATKALFLKKLNTLEEIREQKDKLVELEEYRETTKELSDRMGDLISRLSDMQTISSNKFMNYDYAASRLQEAMTKRNPIKHLNDEYGYGLDKKGSFAEDLSELIKDIKDSPARYFETKFERPVYLNEFAAAVVPKGTSKDVVDALTEAGLPVEEYESGNNEARMAAVDKVSSEMEGVRFRFIGEKGAANLDKAEEATTRLDNLAVAREMESAEKDAKAIKMATGWERGADGLWRYETMDSETAIKDGDESEIRRQIEAIEEEEKAYKKKAREEGIGPDEREEAYINFYRRRGFLEAQLAYVMAKNADVLTHISTSLHHVLDKTDSDSLFKAYPELEFVKVGFATEIVGKALGATVINGSRIEAINLDVKRSTPEQLNGYLAHEIQHAIQEIEGFAPGGDPSMESPRKAEQKANNISFMKDKLDKSVSERNSLLKQRNEINDKMSAWWNAHEDATREDMLADKDMQQFNREYDELSKQIDEADKTVKFNERWLDATLQANTALGYEGYKKLAGEVEARNVTSRLGMTLEQRRSSLASDTEDVAREDQIFLKDGIESGMRFRLSEKGKQIQAEVDKFTSKYNSKPVRIVEAEMDDNELMEALDNAFELEDVKSFMAKSKTAAGYFHNLDKIIIFADRTKVERMEEYLFHENIHAAIHHNNFSNLVAHFYEYAKNEAVFEKWSKLAHNKEYKQYNSSEEFLAYVVSNAMVARNLDDVAEYLEDKQKESLNKLFNVIGYDYDIRRRSNEQSGNGRTGERTPGESSLEGDELLNTGEGRGVGEGTGEGKGRKISPKERKARLNELFGKVADMGLQGVLGNKEYTSLMVDIYKALPEEVRAEIAEDAIRLYGGSVAPAVSDYIGPKSKNSIMDKVVTIVREALRKIGFDLDLNANEVRYMAWRSKKPLDRNNMLEVAEDIDMKYRLKVGEYDGTTPDGGGTRFRRVYHGSGASFDKFDHSFMGTGEGNQSFGWGTYVTDVKAVGEKYAGLKADNSPIAAQTLRWLDENSTYENFVTKGEGARRKKTIENAREFLEDMKKDGASEDVIKAYEQDLKDAERAITEDGYNQTKENMVASLNRHLYEVEIPDDNGSNYIAWDKMLPKEQAERIKDAIRNSKFFKEYEKDYGRLAEERLDAWTRTNGGRVYKLLGNIVWNEKDLSQILSEAGFAGFKYPTNYFSGGNEDGTNNYVIFDEKDLEIKAHTRFRVANKLQVRDEYEATIKKGGYQAREAVQDAMLSLRRFQELIEKASGKKIRDFENAWMHENRLSSVVQAEIHDMERRFYKPMMDAVKKLMKAANLEQEQVADYLMLKHGIERNREMAVRKALTDDKGKIDRTRLEQWYQDKRNVRNRAATPHLDTWRKQQEELDNIALLYGADMSRDYSGLTSMFGTDDLADSTQKAYDEVEALENAHPVETESLGKAIKAMTQNTLDKSFESGLMDRKVYDELSKDMYDYYIPLRGFEETTSEEVYAYLDQDRGAFNAPLKRAKGRSSKSDNPIAYLKSIAESGIMQGNRNKMKQSFLNMVINHPSDLVSVREGVWVTYNPATGEWEVATPPAIPNDATPADVEAAMEAWEQQMEQAAQNDPTLVKKVAEAADVPYRVVGNKMGQHQIIVKRLGKSYTLTINGNPRLAMAINGQTNPNNTSNDGKVAAFVNNKIGSINRSLAAWHTTRNPDFVASNFMRDTFYTNTIVRAKEGNAYANKFHKNYATVLPKMLGLFRKYENGTLNPADQTEAAFLDFMMNGGETGYSNLKDLEEIKKQITKELKGNRFAKVEALAEKLDILNRAVENTARFAAYLTSREEGRSIAKSIFDAKEISVNFNKKGAGGTFFGMTGQTWFGNLAAMVGASGRALYVFFNAAIQGSTNLMHVMKVNPKGTSAGLAAMFLMGAVVPFLFGGDDDDEKDYYDLPEHVRRNHLIVPGAGDAWVSIPLPIEYRIMYGIGELLTSWRTGHERGTDIARKMLSMTGQALPLNFLEEGLEAFVPSAISPIYQVMTNSSWTGLPIYKENDFNKDDPEYTKAYSNVDRNLLKFTKAVYEWTFDEENQEEGIDLNPAVIETLAKGYFGGLATQLSNLAKVGGMIAGEQEFDWRNIPIGNRILKTGDERTKEKRITNEYFENMEKLDFLQSRERMLKKTEKGVEVPETDKFNAQKDLETMQGTEVYKKYQEFKKQKKVVDKIRKTIKEKGSTPEREKQLMEAQEAANKSVR